ncbi:MAG: riboflavin biosynthesis protein RibF [Elusimicrobiota bacterium]
MKRTLKPKRARRRAQETEASSAGLFRGAFQSGCVAAMGTFDGVHRGHAAVLRQAVSLARRRGLPCLALTFARPPRLYFSPRPGPQLLTTLPEKIRLLRSLGVDAAVALPFNKSMARLSAEEFFEAYLIRRFRVRHLVVGYNFLFGRGRSGDAALLRRLGPPRGLSVHVVPPLRLRGVPVSSGQIRLRLAEGDLAAANAKLGHPYVVEAPVVRGRGLGRRLGFPTANLAVSADKILPPGVFAVRAILPGGAVRRGMCNVGFRPTLARPSRRLSVEVHILGFKGRLAGTTLRLEFMRKLRSEIKFPSLTALAARLKLDKEMTRKAVF